MEAQMKLIDIIPLGKENKKTREELMQKANINNVREFRQKIAKLKDEYIIVNDKGYYRPTNKEEYQELIDKLKGQATNTDRVIALAYQEMNRIL